jgi:predicted Rossmann-fold nucleotide-binding protein
MEILTLRQLDVIRKPCVFFNQDGFYHDLLQFFDKMVVERFNKPSNYELFSVAATLPDVFEQLGRAPALAETKWFVTK